jgi:hypothetical protein
MMPQQRAAATSQRQAKALGLCSYVTAVEIDSSQSTRATAVP